MRRILRAGFVGLLLLMPFHALLYVWLGSNLGSLDWFKIWPELWIATMTPLTVWWFVHDRKLRRAITHRKVNWLTLWYILLHLVIAAWKRPEAKALIAGLMINLRLMAMLLLGQVVAHQWPTLKTARLLGRAVVGAGLLTVIFAVLQVSLLPDNFLGWFGYGPSTIRPFTRLHEGSGVLRFSSTLRGPNPFGAYLVLPIGVLVAKLGKLRGRATTAAKHRRIIWFALALCTVALIFTFSRSAWIAAAIAALLGLWLQAKPAQRRKGLAVGLVTVVAVTAIVVVFRDNNAIENSVFHTDESNVATTSNSDHWKAVKVAVREIKQQPMGLGPGTAGPASVNLKHSAPRISENYYLQLAQEVGVLGLVLFVLIFGVLMQRAYSYKTYLWPRALLISGLGLAVANLLLHVWADDSLGIIWWGLAGYYLYLPPKAQPK